MTWVVHFLFLHCPGHQLSTAFGHAICAWQAFFLEDHKVVSGSSMKQQSHGYGQYSGKKCKRLVGKPAVLTRMPQSRSFIRSSMTRKSAENYPESGSWVTLLEIRLRAWLHHEPLHTDRDKRCVPRTYKIARGVDESLRDKTPQGDS